MKEKTVAVVVPCFNEERRLNLRRFRSFAANHPGVEFLFVDDGSTDATSAILASEEEAYPEWVSVLHLEKNVGKGEAVRLGLLQALDAKSSFVAYWDADLATPLEELPHMLACFEDRSEVAGVIGARVRLLGRTIERQALRHYMGRVFASAASLLLHLPVYDTQCGAKVFRATKEFRSVLNWPFRSRWVFDVELIARLKRLWGKEVNRKLIEYPLLAWRDVGGSKLKPGDFLGAMFHLFHLWMSGIPDDPTRTQGKTHGQGG